VRTAATDLLGVDTPIVAFSHCRDVVAAVTNAGGFGVLGVVKMTPEELEAELAWIDQQVRGRPYGLDVLVPASLQVTREAEERPRIPAEHRDFVERLLRDTGVIGPDQVFRPEDGPDTFSVAAHQVEALLDVAFAHPIKLIACALGAPPPYLVERARAAGVPIAALVGSVDHAVKQKDKGVDLIVAQGTEAGGHTGEIGTMVLTPAVVDAVAPIPVLAAGGIMTGRQVAAALALGAAGVWTGSIWLMTDEADVSRSVQERFLAAGCSDTVRSTARTGKPARQLRSDWHQAWHAPGSPAPLPMPLQHMLSNPAMSLISRAADAGSDPANRLNTYYVGQGVGMVNRRRSTKTVMHDLLEETAQAYVNLSGLLEGDPA
jgi:NAD(P)H-dependent flavin oxidoreductase YrpB (nitropropane dioxygenase family)